MTVSNRNNSCLFFRIQRHMKDLLRSILLLNEYMFEETLWRLQAILQDQTIHFRVSNHFLTFCGFVLLSGMVIAYLYEHYNFLECNISHCHLIYMSTILLIYLRINSEKPIAVKSIIDMILAKTYQRLHFMSIFIIMQKYDDSPPTDKLQTLSPVMLNVQTHSFSPV